jgi:hypothetical protein
VCVCYTRTKSRLKMKWTGVNEKVAGWSIISGTNGKYKKFQKPNESK